MMGSIRPSRSQRQMHAPCDLLFGIRWAVVRRIKPCRRVLPNSESLGRHNHLRGITNSTKEQRRELMGSVATRVKRASSDWPTGAKRTIGAPASTNAMQPTAKSVPSFDVRRLSGVDGAAITRQDMAQWAASNQIATVARVTV